MVGSIGSISTSLYQNQVSSGSQLTDDQKTTLEEILAKYDSESMTQESMKSMMDEIKEADIKPCKETREIMDAAGFQPPEKPQGPPPEEETSSTQEIPQCILDFMEKQETGEVTDSDVNSLIQSLLSSGQTAQGSIVDQKV